MGSPFTFLSSSLAHSRNSPTWPGHLRTPLSCSHSTVNSARAEPQAFTDRTAVAPGKLHRDGVTRSASPYMMFSSKWLSAYKRDSSFSGLGNNSTWKIFSWVKISCFNYIFALQKFTYLQENGIWQEFAFTTHLEFQYGEGQKKCYQGSSWEQQ